MTTEESEKVLVTGASGFIGRVLVGDLLSRHYNVTAAVRNRARFGHAKLPESADLVEIGNVGESTNWCEALRGCSNVVHLAGRAHILKDQDADPLQAFRAVNVSGTLNLANQAADKGVRRFIFISSIGVHGKPTGRPFTELDKVNPTEDYSISKLEAEEGLRKIAEKTGMELVVVRPPLVYGPDCIGNFRRLIKLISLGVPLPFGAVDNQRSFVSVWNLSDFLITCLEHKEAGNKTFLVSDGEDISLSSLLKILAHGMNRRAMLAPVPLGLIYAASSLIGKKAMLEKLCTSLTVDSSFATHILGWVAPVELAAGLRKTAQSFSKTPSVG